MKRLATLLFLLAFHIAATAQSALTLDFKEPCDSLNTLLEERTSVKGELKLKAVMKRGDKLDFYFTESLGDYPLHEGDVKWLRTTLRNLFPETYRHYSLGEIKSRKVDVKELEMSHLTFNGKPAKSRFKTHHKHNRNIVENEGAMHFGKGLSGRTIALWQSHGIHFNDNTGRWTWQRPCLFQTVEDLFTAGFVVPYLTPMLENAGAYVIMPRERDTQMNEVIADNDPTSGYRGTSVYAENGKWSAAGTGFADVKETYTDAESPFMMGSARMAVCTEKKNSNTAVWTPDIPERGRYAVYVSYVSLPESTDAAVYTVNHLGGSSSVIVNQKIGGGTWVYIGTFEFGEGSNGSVILNSRTADGHKYKKGSVVTADAVKFGGGMGNIARTPKDSSFIAAVSGMPRYTEGARYWLQWAGAPVEIFHPEDSDSDYKDDFMCRGDWVDWISGGSHMNPERSGKGIPVDLSFGFHTDAGVTPNDSLVGTLAIYTYKSEKKTKLPDGESRMTSREYADIVQSQIVHDLQTQFDSTWTRRQLWDRGYRESRTPSCPAMLLELLSHQNFADMKYGLDPSFRFTVSRAVYKGMLKYLSNRYDIPYVVQPLPVRSIGVRPDGNGKAVIRWRERKDRLEPTASAKGFILYTRIDDGAFDNGKVIECTCNENGVYSYSENISDGHIYSYKVVAFNDGGRSFPSETVSIGIPSVERKEGNVVVVNNFDRVSGPAFFDTPSYAGFDNRSDSGVPYINDLAFIGEMYQFRRDEPWISNDHPGFGASDRHYAGRLVAGNTFDYAAVHGKAIMESGHAFYSCSSAAFCEDHAFMNGAWSTDIICGKQVTTTLGNKTDSCRFTVFSEAFQQALRTYTSNGGNVLISGAYIGSDDSDDKTKQTFTSEVLGYKWITDHAGHTGMVRFHPDPEFSADAAKAGKFTTSPNPEIYCVESPDGLSPTAKDGKVIMRYADTGISAGIRHTGKGYKTVCLGFPIEALEESDSIRNIISTTLEFFKR